MIQHGAAKVYAIDVGYGQLAGKLRVDDRVVNMEKTNIGDVTPDQLDPKPSLATIDLSYLSLKKGIPIVAKLLEPHGDLLCLVKPLFEVEDPLIRRTGVIEDPQVYRQVLEDLVQFTEDIGLNPIDVTYSPVTGNKGTKEFFLWASINHNRKRRNLDEHITKAINAVVELENYKKS